MTHSPIQGAKVAPIKTGDKMKGWILFWAAVVFMIAMMATELVVAFQESKVGLVIPSK